MKKILIVGAGPVGLTLAAKLSQFGIQYTIIDTLTHRHGESRAVGIQPRSLEIFEDLGVLPEILDKGLKMKYLNFYSNTKKLLQTDFKGLDTSYSFMLSLPQKETEKILTKHLKKSHINIEQGVELKNLKLKKESVEVFLKGKGTHLKREEYSYVIGCDGAHSTCRHLLNIPFEGSQMPGHWAIFDAKIEWPYAPLELHLFLSPKGLVVAIPLTQDSVRFGCILTLEETQTKPPPPTLNSILTLLKERVSDRVKLSKVTHLTSYIIHQRQAKTYSKGHVFLAGDAAHVHSPAGGQGMNTGIQDAYNLAWKLALVHKKQAHPNILNTYQEERHLIGKNVVSLTRKITKVAKAKNPFVTLLRDTVMRFINSQNTLKGKIAKKFSELYLEYKPNAIIKEQVKHHPPKYLRAGQRIPDAIFYSCTTKKQTKLYKVIQGSHHSLLLFCPQKTNDKTLLDILKIYNYSTKNYSTLIKTFLICQDQEMRKKLVPSLLCLIDFNGLVSKYYGITQPTLLLVRPDSYVGFINEPPNLKTFQTYLKEAYSF